MGLANYAVIEHQGSWTVHDGETNGEFHDGALKVHWTHQPPEPICGSNGPESETR